MQPERTSPESMRRRIELEVGKKARSLEAQREQKRLQAEAKQRATVEAAKEAALRDRVMRSLEAGFSSDEAPTPKDSKQFTGKTFTASHESTTTFPKAKTPEKKPRNPFIRLPKDLDQSA